jgi:hypothetical protein
MKRLSIAVVLVVLVSSGGIWFGRLTAPMQSFRIEGYICGFTCGGGNYPKEAFARVNDEIPARLNSLLGEYQDSKHLVVVTPMVSGYHIRMAGPGHSRLWDSSARSSFFDWIRERMDAIQLELDTNAEGAPSIH